MKKNSLAMKNPALAKEWHPTLNGDLTPWDVTCGMGKKVWWVCSKGHEWNSVVNDRNQGSGCPYCSGQRVVKGETDLATVNPALANEWHRALNGNLTPSDVTCGSGKKVWWECNEHAQHSWEARIADRSEGTGCPYCTGKKILHGYNDLAELNPELSREWHSVLNGDVTPADVMCGSNKKFWWQCAKNQQHQWEATVAHRNSGRGCPYCSGHRASLVSDGRRNSVVFNPELKKEWHPTLNGNLTPGDLTGASGKKVWWQCQKHKAHVWKVAVVSRNAGKGCPYCSNKKVLAGYNDLQTMNPELAKEWHTTLNGSQSASGITSGSSKKAWWKCHRGHEWESTINSRNTGRGCPYCAGKRVLNGYNDLATINPSLAREWHPTKNGTLMPSNVSAGSCQKVWWVCRKEHEWQAAIEKRNIGGGCPKCNAEKQTSFPEQVIYYYLKQAVPVKVENRACVYGVEVDIYIPEWHLAIEYDGVYYHSSIKSAIREAKKTETLSQNNIQLIRIKETSNCETNAPTLIYCVPDNRYLFLKSILLTLVELLSETKGIPMSLDVNIERDRFKIMEQYVENEKAHSVAFQNPKIAAEWHPTKNGRLTPENIALHSKQKFWWQCSKHKEHEWEAAPLNRNASDGCPCCSNRKVVLGYNDLSSTNPDLAKEWHSTLNGELYPTLVTAGSNKLVWWQCDKKHEWRASVNNRNSGSGCPYCSGRYTAKGETDLATTHPEIAAEWHPLLNGDLTPFDVVAGSNKKVWWQCDEKHEWQTKVFSRKKGFGHCPECKKNK